MRKIALVLAALFSLGEAQAQPTQASLDAEINALLPSNNRNEITAANLRQVLTDMVSASYGLGGWVNTINPQIAAYTVEATDNWTTLALGGGAFYALTFNSPSSYPSHFAVMVLNEDDGRAKWISLTNGTSFYLWPGQSVLLYSQNGAWQTMGRSRWKAPAGALTVNVDPVNGSDAAGVADGLATGAGAFKSINNALSTIFDQFDLNGTTNPTTVTILLATGATDTEQIHFSPHGFVGAQGGAAILIDGGGGTLNVSGGSALQLYFGAVIRLRHITITSSGGNGIDALWGSKVYVEDLVTFGSTPAANAALNVQHGAHVEFDDSFTISGGGGYFIANTGGFVVAANPITATVSANVSFLDTIFGAAGGLTDFGNVTWSVGSFTVTASQGAYNLASAATLLGAANVPGSVAGISQFAVQDVYAPAIVGGTAPNSVLQLISTSNGSPSGDSIQFITAGILRASMASNGNIGWNIQSPDSPITINGNGDGTATVAPTAGTQLHVIGADGVSDITLLDAFGQQNLITARRADGMLTDKSALSAGDIILNITAQGWNGSAYSTGAGVTLYAQDNWASGSDQASKIVFFTTPPSSATIGEAGQIWGSGAISFGTLPSSDPGKGVFTLARNTAVPSAHTGTGFQLVAADDSYNLISLDGYGTGSGMFNAIIGRAAGGTTASPAATPSNSPMMILGGHGYDTAFESNTSGDVTVKSLNQHSTSDHSTFLQFDTTPSGSTTNGTVMRLYQGLVLGSGTTDPGFGNLSVGGTIAAGLSSAAQTNVACFNSSTGLFTYQAWSTGCASSAERFKEGITSLEDRANSLMTVLRLAPVLFRYRAETGLGADEHYGFIADRVAHVAPHLVTYDSDGRPYAVKYQELAPVLVGAIQQLALLVLIAVLGGGSYGLFLEYRRRKCK